MHTNNEPHYDLHQFQKPLGPEFRKTNLSYEDTEHLHSVRHPRRERRWIPAWSTSDEKLKRVIAQRAWAYVRCFYGGVIRPGTGRCGKPGIVPDALANNREALTTLTEKLFVNVRNTNALRLEHRKHLERSAVGYLELQAAVLYRAYRLGYRSQDIAEELGVSACAVRQWLVRANKAAHELGYETFERHHSFGIRKK